MGTSTGVKEGGISILLAWAQDAALQFMGGWGAEPGRKLSITEEIQKNLFRQSFKNESRPLGGPRRCVQLWGSWLDTSVHDLLTPPSSRHPGLVVH